MRFGAVKEELFWVVKNVAVKVARREAGENKCSLREEDVFVLDVL